MGTGWRNERKEQRALVKETKHEADAGSDALKRRKQRGYGRALVHLVFVLDGWSKQQDKKQNTTEGTCNTPRTPWPPVALATYCRSTFRNVK